MRIDPTASGFPSSPLEAQTYQKARKVVETFEQLSADVVQLDNRPGVDHNDRIGQLKLQNASVRSASSLETTTSGTVELNDKKQVQKMELYGADQSGFRYHENHGVLGLGQDRKIYEQDSELLTQQVIAFQDGTVLYEEFPRTI